MLRGIVSSLRPRRWVKNVVFFAGILFSRNIEDFALLTTTLIGFALLCLATGAGYLINDLFDRKSDALHSEKKKRPIASGALPTGFATVLAVILPLAAVIGSFALDAQFGAWIGIYVIAGLAYSAGVQRVPILELFVLAFLFLIRVLAGAVLIDVPVSKWLLICGLLLALFLALSRRRWELSTDDADGDPRLAHYSHYLIDQMIAVVTSATLVAYTLYTFSPETTEKFGSRNLVYTVPFVLYGIFRYLYVIYQKKSAFSPENEIVLDRPLLINSGLYLLAVSAVLYFS